MVVAGAAVVGAAVVGAAVVGAEVVGAAVVGAAVVTAAPVHDSDSSPMASNANLVSVRTLALSSSAVPVGYKSRNWGALHKHRWKTPDLQFYIVHHPSMVTHDALMFWSLLLQ